MSFILEIMLTFMKIGALAFGGGYAALPLIQEQVVDIKGWMTFSEFADIMAIDELTPGPILINAATFVGTKLAGVPGAIAATIGSVIPSLIICLVLVILYNKFRSMKLFEGALSGLRCMVVGLIASTALTMLISTLFGGSLQPFSPDLLAVCIAAAAFIVFRVLDPNPILVVLGCGAVSLIASLLT